VLYTSSDVAHVSDCVQSWKAANLFNLWQRQLGPLKSLTEFRTSSKTLFQQRWASKQLIRAFHGDFINEKAFKRWYLPKTLPDVRPRVPLSLVDDIGKFAGNKKTVAAQDKARRAAEDNEEEELAPVGSLMFSEIERRIDVLIFRSCLAQSVYDARRLVVHGYVMLNGKKVRSHAAPHAHIFTHFYSKSTKMQIRVLHLVI
jgi:ribosomal protein S4